MDSKYADEYDEVAMMLNSREWPELKAKLSGPDADRVGRCIQAYIAAYGDHIKMEDDFEKFKCDWNTAKTYAYWDKHDWFKEECERTLIHEMVLFDELQVLVKE
jgi:hypothetical protein